jgi:DNA-binding response OmpR family regulator
MRFNPEVVITGCDLISMDVLDFIKNLRCLTENVKVIALSTYFQQPENGYAFAMIMAGADICISKPIECFTLKSTVTSLLSNYSGFQSRARVA